MKIKTITLGLMRTVRNPYDQFSPVKPSISITAELDESEFLSDALSSLSELVHAQINDEKKKILAQLKGEMSDEY